MGEDYGYPWDEQPIAKTQYEYTPPVEEPDDDQADKEAPKPDESNQPRTDEQPVDR